jgi:uncharacterized protein
MTGNIVKSVGSPCNQVCVIDEPIGICIGCGRTLGEIAEWQGAKPARQRAIIARLPKRLAFLPTAKQAED